MPQVIVPCSEIIPHDSIVLLSDISYSSMPLRTKGIETDRYKLVHGVDEKDYSSKLKGL